ncbi:FIST C-terminal domain-containing protein [Marinospirillum sp. MEB164]|uniref:FIST C-terminal domain-containing protein n=1 Tax=Marinospirillum alkalitolerans TaxID=3123374 RepID=A0ABW8PX82_9GAMM
MQLSFCPSADFDQLKQALTALEAQNEIHSALVFAADANGWSDEQLNPLLTRSRLTLVGGLFPQIIYQHQAYEQGFVLLALSTPLDWAVIPGLSDPEQDFDAPLEALADAWEASDHEEQAATHLLLVDGLATRIATLIESVFDQFGLAHPHIGGGAGSLSFEQKPCIITPEGLMMDVALLARLPLRASLGVAHGWQPISLPMEVTRAHKNEVHQLNWQPAFQRYQTEIEAHSGQKISADSFFDLAKSYPLGINRLGAELLVRDPLLVKNQSTLVCVGEVPEGALVRLLTGSPASLIEAAGQATLDAERLWQQQNTHDAEITLVIDCISRVLFMGEQINQELAQTGTARPQFGVLSLGEIANAGQDYLAFYNKTIVVGLLGQDKGVTGTTE